MVANNLKTCYYVIDRRYEKDDTPVEPISPKAVQKCFPEEVRLSAATEDDALEEARRLTSECRSKACDIIKAAAQKIVDEDDHEKRADLVRGLLMMKEILDFSPDYQKCLYKAQLDEDGQLTGVYWNVRDDSDDVD